MKKIGILALQGDFEAHARTLTRLGADPIFVRTTADLETVDALVIPGGESTTILKLLHVESLLAPLAAFGRRRPIFGTCAGAILLAARVSHPGQEGLALMDIDIERNAYGRQIDSRVAHLTPESEFAARTHPGEMEAVFIRAPVIRRVGPQARILARYQGDPVLVEQGKHLVATFHPELTADSRVHELFLSKL
ncbi:MAG TPA: pyridoxal 5'-phosphate synthase glutaminase subunit PdxT [Bryobacteraceae bacterium]|jgi:pyridoxal 5'-phosphate synthase pdxT subunit|nr:pyridoxal 5'-phosphate synthase glutaminase subunit PdxT [Bryobacteraceae bacterium]